MVALVKDWPRGVRTCRRPAHGFGVDRSASTDTAPGFEQIGWAWGGRWPEPNFQHFAAPE